MTSLEHDKIPGQINHNFTTMSSWHTLEADAVFQQLFSSTAGLSQQLAEDLLQQLGPNRLSPAKKKGPLARLLAQFHNVLIYVLLGAGMVTAILGHWVDSSVIRGRFLPRLKIHLK
ncbi:MAG: hypothetical protein KBT63_08795 [Porticoccaceae bacterium]|nr:hypothetical protein [Porticoccaceae bacterium]